MTRGGTNLSAPTARDRSATEPAPSSGQRAPARMGRVFSETMHRVVSSLNAAAMVLLVLMMVLGTADVMGRYLFHHPILGTRELSGGYLMVGIVWLSLANTERIDGHIGVDIAVRKASEKTRGWLLVAGRLVAIVPIALISLETYYATLNSWGQKTRGSIELYVAPSWALVSAGAALLAATLATRAIAEAVRLTKGDPSWN